MNEFSVEQSLPASPEAALEWHARPGAFERLLPPWANVSVMERCGTIRRGHIVLRLRRAPWRFDWILDYVDPDGGSGFADVQRQGPFRSWRHDHLFRGTAEGSVLLDRIRFELPRGLGLAEDIVRRDLARLFRYRHRVVRDDLDALARAGPSAPLTVAVTGSRGLVGSALIAALGVAGHRVVRLVRSRPRREDEMQWSPTTGLAPVGGANAIDAVVHLAGEGIADGIWTAGKMQRIRDSRALGTLALAESLARLTPQPRVLIGASAVGWYGERGDEPLDENSPSGDGFLPDVAHAWESALDPAARAGIRTVSLRLGLVLTPRGGLLGKMLAPFRAGLGGTLGSGRQWMSWVSLDDVVFAALHALHRGDVRGPVNVTAPEPVTNATFTRTLARVLGRPAFFPVPAALFRAVSRPMAEEVFLVSQRVVGSRLSDTGFRFRDATLEPTLRHALGR